jgi:muramoyltetrapeptide carboxypeptidase
MFADPSVNAVFAIRGGYGSAQLLDRIDYGLLRNNPKIFLGYSDITALHLAIQKRSGMVTFHGPVALSGFSEYTQKGFRRALFETAPLGSVTNPPESNPLRPAHTLRAIRPGKARGALVGGNLTLISTTMGTPFEIETRGRILLLEDVDEQPYSIDRMLTQLRLAGKFDGVAGVVFGECNACRPRDYKPAFESTLSLGEVLDEILGQLRVPVLSGLTFGHTDDQLTLPLGVMAALDADKGELVIEEAGVSL